MLRIRTLARHKKTHTRDLDDRPYVCDEPGCGATFSIRNTLNNHKKNVHIDGRSFECDFPGCKDSFKTEGVLKTHKMKRHSETQRLRTKASSALRVMNVRRLSRPSRTWSPQEAQTRLMMACLQDMIDTNRIFHDVLITLLEWRVNEMKSILSTLQPEDATDHTDFIICIQMLPCCRQFRSWRDANSPLAL